MKAGHGLGWFVSLAVMGQPPQTTASGDEYAPVEAGFFGIKRPQLATWEPPWGNNLPMLFVQLGTLASAVGLPHLALKVFKQADSLTSDEQRSVLFEMGKRTMASLAARVGDPREAIALGLRAAKASTVGQHLRQHGRDPQLETDLGGLWLSLDSPAREKAMRGLLDVVLAPGIAESLGSSYSAGSIQECLSAWHGAIIEASESSDNGEFLQALADYLHQLTKAWSGEAAFDAYPQITEEELVLKVLWHLSALPQSPHHHICQNISLMRESVREPRELNCGA